MATPNRKAAATPPAENLSAPRSDVKRKRGSNADDTTAPKARPAKRSRPSDTSSARRPLRSDNWNNQLGDIYKAIPIANAHPPKSKETEKAQHGPKESEKTQNVPPETFVAKAAGPAKPNAFMKGLLLEVKDREKDKRKADKLALQKQHEMVLARAENPDLPAPNKSYVKSPPKKNTTIKFSFAEPSEEAINRTSPLSAPRLFLMEMSTFFKEHLEQFNEKEGIRIVKGAASYKTFKLLLDCAGIHGGGIGLPKGGADIPVNDLLDLYLCAQKLGVSIVCDIVTDRLFFITKRHTFFFFDEEFKQEVGLIPAAYLNEIAAKDQNAPILRVFATIIRLAEEYKLGGSDYYHEAIVERYAGDNLNKEMRDALRRFSDVDVHATYCERYHFHGSEADCATTTTRNKNFDGLSTKLEILTKRHLKKADAEYLKLDEKFTNLHKVTQPNWVKSVRRAQKQLDKAEKLATKSKPAKKLQWLDQKIRAAHAVLLAMSKIEKLSKMLSGPGLFDGIDLSTSGSDSSE